MEHATTVKLMVSAAGGAAVYWLGGLDKLLTALVALIVLDYISGVIKAVHDRVLSSGAGLQGIVKKVMILSIVALSFILQKVTGGAMPLREITIMFFIANEGISVLENAAAIGLPLPGKLKSALKQMRDKAA